MVTKVDAINAAKLTIGVRLQARKALSEPALSRFEIISAFVIEVITRIKDKFTDSNGNIQEPKGALKGIRYAVTGIWLIVRVIRLIRDLR